MKFEWDFGWHCSLSRFKVFEIQFARFGEGSWFKFRIDWSKKTDHAGLSFYIDIFHVFLEAKVYDSRHWDYENNRWENTE